MINFAGMLGNWLSSEVGNEVPGILDKGIRSLAFSIATFIYKLIISFYNIFEKLCGGRFFDSSMLKDFSERIGVILGVVMLFIAMFSMIKMVIDPEKVSDKEMGARTLITKIIIVMAMLGFSNFVFSLLYEVQDRVLEENIISKILLPIRVNEETADSFGNVLAEELFMSFYQIEENIAETEDYGYCQNVIWQFRDQIITSGNFNLGRECLSESVKVNSGGGTIETFLINYNWLLSLVAGAVVAYLIFSYCISVGIRMIQLLFLEIISPMAIISYLVPKKDTMFGKWGKIYIATYLDVFIRVVIIDFIVFIIATIFSSNVSFINDITDDKGIVMAILIIALLTFAKKAPDLIKELFPAGASKLGFGMKSPKQIFDGMLGGNVVKTGAKMATGGAVIGLAGAGISALSRYNTNKNLGKSNKTALAGAALGAFTGFGRGIMAGGKSGGFSKNFKEAMKNQEQIDDKYMSLREQGGTTLGMLRSKVTDFVNETPGQRADRRKVNMNNLGKFFADSKAAVDEIPVVKNCKSDWQNAQRLSNETQVEFEIRREELRKRYFAVRNKFIEFAITGDEKLLDYDKAYKDENGQIKYKKGNYYDDCWQHAKDENGNEIEGVAGRTELINDALLGLEKVRSNALSASKYASDNAVEFTTGAKDSDGKLIFERFEGNNELVFDSDLDPKNPNLSAAQRESLQEFYGKFRKLEEIAKTNEFYITDDNYGVLQAEDKAAGVNEKHKHFERK